mmetsp:Transcript_6144/g.7956  ORF Transcript_6144/g.7956 Transcript_6144/m.7956 type:complete len:270 (-) Transcript_6144:260-1069(-)|eukprot:CAMPEP_0198150682 /NCGR_PEP_ID=MMETSP1443-20131203/51944_1 /TAXON_ID=186043 /ORGANISM="Entomoneis sp., Strain CCMP2396" /LENGTH=269 /DNA_ID=CAMNT_0043816067 /DNA_START=93 /DNA_END=902 /DNA_ORIENTATION=+
MSAEENAELNRQNESRMEEIEQNIRANQPLTSERLPLAELLKQYTDPGSSNFRANVAILQNHYGHLRMVRGDGNCYYRAFLFSLVEHLLLAENKAEGERILHWVKNDSWKQVLAMGYDEITLEIFYDSLVDLFERVLTGKLDFAAFHSEMNQETATSDYCTWYMRVITATHLKLDPIRFEPFIEQPGLDVQQFCQREVEPMGKECEMLQALALAEAFGIAVQIEYLDGHELPKEATQLSHHIVGQEKSKAKLFLTLLYRPGHYDILYVK